MKKLALLSLVILISVFSRAELSKSVVSTAGGLSAAIGADINSVTNLTVSGTIDASDFVALFNMPVLSVLDLGAVTINAYVGINGPLGAGKGGGALQYPPNTIPANAFYENRTSKTSLTSVIFPTSLTTIADYTFYGCSGLSSVTFSASLAYINSYAFYNCSSLSDITIPSSVSIINSTAFQGCAGLNSYIVDANNLYYSSLDGVLFNKLQTTLIQCPALKVGVYTIPATVTTLADAAFMNCINLTSVNIPTSITTIPDYAFSNCTGFTTITFPPTATIIRSSVLSGCSGLASIYAYASTPVNLASQTNDFLNVNKNTCTLYVPIGSLAAYRAAIQWLDFVNIIESNSIPYLSLSPTTMNVAASQSSPIFDVSSNVSWTASSNGSWITLNSYAGSNSATITITIESNPTLLARASSVAIFGPGMPTKYISVNQAAGVPGFSVSVDSIKVIAGQYSSGQFTINSTVDWSVSSNQSWLTLNIPSGSGNSNINVYATENLLPQTREAIVTVSADGLPSKTIIVTQAKWKPLLSVSKNDFTFTSERVHAHSVFFDITSNTNWNVSSNKSWLKVSDTFGSNNITIGSNNKTIYLEADYNNLISGRTATITVSGTGLTPQIITVTQQGKSPFLSVSSDIIYISTAENLKYDIELASTTTWNIQSNQPWLSINKTSGWDDATITIEAAVNTSGSSRSATLTFSGIGVTSKFITVKQASSTLISKSVNISAGGLSSALSHSEASTITDLTITGTFDDRDFDFIRDSLPELQHLDLSASTITKRIENSIMYCGDNAISGNMQYKRWTNYVSTIVLPNNLVAIGQYAFSRCNTLKNIQLPSTLNLIDQFVFYQCYNLTTAQIPSNLTRIESSAFRECKSLKSLVLPSTVNYIDEYAFWGCVGLTSFTDYSHPIINYYSTFANFPVRYNNIADYSITNGVELIEWETFANCDKMNSISIPLSVDTINHFAFYNCSASITVDPNNTAFSSIDGVLYNKNKTEIVYCPITKTGSYTIPSTVTNIRENAFVNCVGLTSISVPPGVTSIGASAFIGCTGLTSITIPSAVTTIDYDAFKGCSSLTSIYANAVTPIELDSAPNFKKYYIGYGYIYERVFRNINKATCTLYVPIGSLDAYRAAPQWQDFLNIIESITTKTINTQTLSIQLLCNYSNNSFIVTGLKENAALALVDLNGKVIQSKQISENESVSMNSYPQGVYIVKIITSEGVFIQKILNK